MEGRGYLYPRQQLCYLQIAPPQLIYSSQAAGLTVIIQGESVQIGPSHVFTFLTHARLHEGVSVLRPLSKFQGSSPPGVAVLRTRQSARLLSPSSRFTFICTGGPLRCCGIPAQPKVFVQAHTGVAGLLRPSGLRKRKALRHEPQLCR